MFSSKPAMPYDSSAPPQADNLPSSSTSINAGASRSSVSASMKSRMGTGISAIGFHHHFFRQFKKRFLDTMPCLGAGIDHSPLLFFEGRRFARANLPLVSKIRLIQQQQKRHLAHGFLCACLQSQSLVEGVLASTVSHQQVT